MRLNELIRILRGAGYEVEQKPGGKHWRLIVDGSSFPIPRHKKNPTILRPILRKLAKKLGVSLQDLEAGTLIQSDKGDGSNPPGPDAN